MRLLPIVFSLLFTPIIQAALAPTEPVDGIFDAVSANKRFDQISIKLSTENLNLAALNQSIKELDHLSKKADSCVRDTGEKIAEVDGQIKRFFGDDGYKVSGVDSKYLEDQKKNLTDMQSTCRLFSIRANEAIEAYHSASLSLQQEITFTRGEDILERMQQIPEEISNYVIPALNKDAITTIVGSATYSLPLLLIAFLISTQLQRSMSNKEKRNKFYLFFHTALLFVGGFLLVNSVFVKTPFAEPADNVIFKHILTTTLSFIGLFLLRDFILLHRQLAPILRWQPRDILFLKRLTTTIIIVYFTRKLGLKALELCHLSHNVVQLFEDAFLMLSLIAMTYFTLVVYRNHRNWFKTHFRLAFLYKLTALVVILLVALDFVGYSILAIDSAYMLISLLLFGALGIVLIVQISKIYQVLSYNPHYQGHLKKFFGYTGEPPFLELLFLKIIAQALVVIGLLFALSKFMNEIGYYINIFLNTLFTGFKISSMNVYPIQWLVGLFFFNVLSIVSRHISTSISQSQQYDEEEEKQVAFASIVLYLGISIAAILGLLIAGFSFTSLAIITGALSVGVGLGLQSIVNNFFSGLILLIEKPIKVGDRIMIDNVEGFVKKISIRSTQLVTPAQEDVIIPNSDLITHQVTNYMYSNKYSRVRCEIGVAYGSNTDEVHDLMLEVANEHPEVVKGNRYKPIVLFRSFGDSNLQFELWCLIKDVNRKLQVNSELNFALEKAFRKHNITMAFPQRDVHVTFDQENVPWSAKE